MYRLVFILVVILAIGAGLVVGSLNSDPVLLDLLWFQLNWPLGLVVMATLALGIIIGSMLVWIFQVLPLQVRNRRLQANITQTPAPALEETIDD